jgi:hypothetical protein
MGSVAGQRHIFTFSSLYVSAPAMGESDKLIFNNVMYLSKLQILMISYQKPHN